MKCNPNGLDFLFITDDLSLIFNSFSNFSFFLFLEEIFKLIKLYIVMCLQDTLKKKILLLIECIHNY